MAVPEAVPEAGRERSPRHPPGGKAAPPFLSIPLHNFFGIIFSWVEGVILVMHPTPIMNVSDSSGPPFRCPLCGADGFVEVVVRKPNGSWYKTEFLKCCGCSVMFQDPERFTRCKPPPEDDFSLKGWGSGAASMPKGER